MEQVSVFQRLTLHLRGDDHVVLLHMAGLENSECIWTIQRKWLYPFHWLKILISYIRWLFLSNLSDGGAIDIFKCGSRKEKYLLIIETYSNEWIGTIWDVFQFSIFIITFKIEIHMFYTGYAIMKDKSKILNACILCK